MQRVNEMTMPDARGPLLLKVVNRILHAISTALNEIRHQEKARAIETIMTMNRNETWALLGSDLVHEVDEDLDLVRLGRLLGDGGEFVIRDAVVLEAFGVIHGVVVRDVDNSGNFARIFLRHDFRRVFGVDFTESLHGAEDASDGLRNGWHGSPFLQVLDVPFAFG